MDVERALLSKIVSTGEYAKVVAKQIHGGMFSDDESRDMWDFIAGFVRKYKTCPSIEAAKESKPGFEFEHIQEPIEYVIDRFQVLVRKRMAQDLIFELGAAIDDPDQASEIELRFLEAAREIAMAVPTDEVARFSDMDKRQREQVQAQKEGLKPGIPFGFPYLDDKTGGIQSHEFITVAAFSGVGKTTLLNAIAFNVYSNPTEDYVGLYIPLEMSAKALLARFDAMAAGLDYKKLKHLDLDEESLENWVRVAENIKKKMKSKDIIIADKIRHCTPDKVYAEMIRHNPDIVFLDYLSLMRSSSPSRSSSMWQSLTEITQDLKQTARMLEIPIVAAAQTNRSSAKEGADLDNIGYALSVVQDSDIVLGLHADDQMKAEQEMEIRLRKNREGALGQFRCLWNHEEMLFRQKDLTDRFGRPGNGSSSANKGARITVDEIAKQRQKEKPKTQRPTKRPAPRAKPTRQRPIKEKIAA